MTTFAEQMRDRLGAILELAEQDVSDRRSDATILRQVINEVADLRAGLDAIAREVEAEGPPERYLFLITICLPRNPEHDPHNKVSDWCPIDNGAWCTDSTGAHHTIAVWVPGDADADHVMTDMDLSRWPGARVTRVETTAVTRRI